MTDADTLRANMVARLQAAHGFGEPVAAAMRAVPRHLFVPGTPVEPAYADEPIVTKRDADGVPISSSSQPTIMALMLEQLGVRPGDRVLEIGAGTGYNCALLAHLAGPSGTVVGVDIDDDVVEAARRHLAAAGRTDVVVARADGAQGYPDQAPYDRIIATVGVWDLAPAWLEQLAPGGRIVVPLDLRGTQRSVAFERTAEGHWTSVSVVPCGFMRMRGALAGPEITRVLDRDTRLMVFLPEGGAPDAVLETLDSGATAEVPTTVLADPGDLLDGLSLWLAVHEPRWGTLSELGDRRLPDAPVTIQDMRMTAGIFAADGTLAVLATDPDTRTLTARAYGPHRDLATALAAHVTAWDEAGRPDTTGLHLDAYTDTEPPPGPVTMRKRHTVIAVTWAARF
ncbi:protein-L-isoaspartate(D-aspartate) O-methyltransferase [Thermocatellispora tengchongensis]|uniref:Protein-L-isoaspartate O-methyltransferase n=1 Tax=Thermocatellispora tengchongensis TaxID=1073253 RepID=A0A840PR46_9ACTN|nr:methyltransferase, FxLD system [Thermocatellispora tengchongensis]MBB5139567.1 protein-L-isoaspartate(D-aspartate) O-methyltransferase [Thermocatellispora tengchongensis]